MEENETKKESFDISEEVFKKSLIVVGIVVFIVLVTICCVVIVNKDHFIELIKQREQEKQETQSTLTPYEQKSISEMNWVHDNCEMTGYSSFGFGDSEQQYEYECNNGEHVSTYKGRIFYRSKQY